MKSNNIKYIEDSLKRFIKKSRNISYSMATLVAFLITGFISYSSEVSDISTRTELANKIINEKNKIDSKLKEAEETVKDIDLKIEKLLRRGNFWIKPLENSYQIFFSANWNNYNKNKNRTKFNFKGPEYTSNPSFLSSKEKETYYENIYYGGEGVIKNPLEFTDSIDFGANISPKKVEEKTVTVPTARKAEVKLTQITAPDTPNIAVTAPTVTAPTTGALVTPTAPNINVAAPGSIAPLGQISVTEIAPLNINVSTPSITNPAEVQAPTVQAPATPGGFNPRLISPPTAPGQMIAIIPSIFDPPEIKFKGYGFGQGAAIGMPKNNIILQNYDTYDTVNKDTNEKGIINIEVGSGTKWWGSNTDGTKNSNVQLKVTTNVPNAATPGLTKGWNNPAGAGTFYLTDGSSGIGLNAFINELRDHNATISGNYIMTNKGGGNSTSRNTIFLSHNPAGVGNGPSHGVPGGPYDGQGKAEAKTATFNGNLTINGTNTPFTGSTAHSDVTIGVEHQLWSRRTHNDWITEGAYSIFDNKGTINLASGYNMVGILIDVEAWGNQTLADNSGVPHKTINSGKILVNGGNSIGIDYGEYTNLTFKSDLTIGDVIVGGSKNYGLRMANIFSQNPSYFDKGVTINSGGANKKILVQGKNNIGVSIAKFLSSTANSNPIANIKGLNIEVDGVENVGFLRHKDYENNSGNMVLNAATMGTFSFGDNAEKSTLIRTDKNGIKIEKDITVSKGKKDNSFAQAISSVGATEDSSIINAAKLTSKNLSSFAGIIGTGSRAMIENNGSIEIEGEEKNIGLAILNGSSLKNTGTIEVLGTGIQNIGIYNDGSDAILSNGSRITVKGKDSAALYNKTTTKIDGTVTINANGGATAIYGEGGTINSTANDKLTVNVSSTGEGVAVYGKNSAAINLQNANLNITDGAAGVASVDTGTNINLTGATIKYDGSGYAIYSDGKGKVDISDSTIKLKGKSTAFDVNLSATTLPITLNANTRIKVNSDDVIAFNLKEATGLTTVGGIENFIKGRIENKIGLGVGSLNNLFTGSTSTKYKVAAVDGGSITLGNLDKTGKGDAGESQAQKDGHQYFNRFLGQRLKATTNSGSTISAKLSSADANARYNGQVVGLEMNSSKNANSVNETAIKLVNSTLEADRTDAGTGAVGAFINYGKVDVDASSKILVEKEANTVNDKAVGIYAVNGSIVNNKGEVSVGGNQSIGVLGMAYRTDNSNKLVVDEFGHKAAGQGKVSITNDTGSKIVMSGENAIGIYAENNKTGSSATDHSVVNKGEITVGKSSGTSTSIGIYANNVSVKPESGKINLGEKAIGIYAKDSKVGESGKDLGTVKFTGDNGVALYLTGDKNKTQLAGSQITLENPNSKNGNIGLFIDHTSNAAPYETNIKVLTGSSDNITAYYTKSGDLTVKADGKINKNSVGLTGVEGKSLTYGDSNTNHTLEVGEKSIGILGNKSNISLGSKANIKLVGNEAVGIYSNVDSVTNKRLILEGNVNIEADKAIGVYSLNGTVNVNPIGADVRFGNNAKNSIAYYLAGSNWNGPTSYGASSTNLTYAHDSNNIYLYGQAAKSSDGTIKGSFLNVGEIINITPTGVATANKKAIGIYLNTLVKDTNNEYANNLLKTSEAGAQINVVNKAIGVYAENASDSKYNEILKPEIVATGEETVGVYTNGNLKLASPTGTIAAKQKAIGIYGNKGKVLVEDKQNINIENQGTGLYLTNGSHLENGELILENKTANKAAAGVYYTKGTSTSQVINNTELNVKDGNDILALYVDGGIDLKNNKDIKISKNKGNVATFVTGNSKFTNNADITLEGTNLKQALGVYVQNGEAINTSEKTIKVKDEEAGSISVGMAAVKSATGSKAIVNNVGKIEVTGDAIGMYVDNNSSGTNSGTITAKDSGTMKAIGSYVKGNNASFKNIGSISSDSVALALEDTKTGKIVSGTLSLTKDNAVGVYAKNSVIDFDVAPTTTKEKTVGLFAEGNTEIEKTVTSATGKGHVGVYLKDNNVKFKAGSKVVVNNGVGTDFGTGIYTDKAFNGDIKTDIQQNGDKTIGLFLGNNGGTGSTVNYTGTIGVGTGIGVYAPNNTNFISKNTTFNVNGGTAVYLKGGNVDLGNTGKATINFGNSGGTAIYQDGGTINTGTGLSINGSGSFLALKNANSTINSLVKVGANGIGINSTYDKTGSDYLLSLGNSGKIELNGDKSTGIAATANGLAPNKVTIKNEGTIKTTSGTQAVGIFAKGAHVENSTTGKISIGEKGIGIFTTNDSADANTKLENKGEINLVGNEAIGILANKANTTEPIIGGKISGTKDSLTGIYVKGNTSNIEVKDFSISLGEHAKGLVFDNGSNFKVSATGANNTISIANTTDKTKRGIGIAAIGAVGVVKNTDISIGTDSLGLYAKGGSLDFTGKLKSSTGSSILAYADEGSKISLSGTGTLSVGTNGIALGAYKGTVSTATTTNVEVNGSKGIGAYVVGDNTSKGSISNNFEVKVKSADGIGVYAKGNVDQFAKVTEIKGNSSKGHIFDNLTNKATISAPLQLSDANATDQIGAYALGTGAGLETNGISVIGSRNIGVYNKVNQNITNNGGITIGDSIANKTSIGIFSDNSTENSTARNITTNDIIKVGANSVGIYSKNSGVTQTAATKDITIANKGIGILVENTDAYYNKGNVSVAGKVSVGENGAVGIQTENANINLANNLMVGKNDSKGIYSTKKGNIFVSGDIAVGADSIGIYKKGNGTVQTGAGKTLTVGEKAYGIFSENAVVENKSNISVAKNGVGIYGAGANLNSNANVTVGESGIGLYLKSDGTKMLSSTGVHTIGNNKAIGIYADNANIEMKAGSSMTIGDNDSVGIFSKGSGKITTNGDITVGKSSIGIYKDGKGELNIGSSSQNLNIGEKGYGIYYIGSDKANSKIQSNMNMTLAREAVGIYGKNTSIVQNGNITVGETTISSDGYANPDNNKNSIGIFSDASDVSYKGKMTVDKPLSVGIYGRGSGSITLKSGTDLTVKNGAIGIMTGQGVRAINIENGATINVSGKAKDVDSNAGDKNVSFGITAYSGLIDNKGTINVSGKATGIYLGGTASLLNRGTIVIDPTTGGTALGNPNTKTNTGNIGGIRITDAGKVTINDRVISGGTVKIKGDLNMQGMGIDVSTGKTLIDASSISGTAHVLPNFSKGNSEQKITIKDVFKVSPGGIGSFTGDVKSKSVSWVAKISKEFSDTTTKDITLARIPYNALIKGERYKNLAAGLEEFRMGIPVTKDAPIFKSLDKISDHGTFAKAVADMRGDVYSNIQERMKTVENVFEKSYSELLDSYNVTKDVNKFSVIHSQGKHKDDTLGVSGYKYSSLGVLYLNDREAYSYGGKYGWSAGLIGSNFDFEGRTNRGSKENIISGKLGLHYQKALDRNDDNAQLKYLSRVELTVNKHKTKRNILIGKDAYNNKATYYSADLSWKNRVFYDYDINTKWSMKPFAGLDLSYGHIWDISENGNGMKLNVKGEDYFVTSPNIGVETKYTIPVGNTKQVVVKADAKVSYDMTELYDKTNKAKIKGTSQGYFDLSRPEKRRIETKLGVELGLEKTNNYGLSLRAEYTGNKKSDFNYGLRFNYKF